MAAHLANDTFWVDKPKYDEAERIYCENLASVSIFHSTIFKFRYSVKLGFLFYCSYLGNCYVSFI